MKCPAVSAVSFVFALCWAGGAWAHEHLALPLASEAASASQARPAPAPAQSPVGLRDWIKSSSKPSESVAVPYRLSEPQRQHLREQLRAPLDQSETPR